MIDWWRLTDNGFEQPEYPQDIALREERKQQRMMKENDPYFVYDEWKKKGGRLPKWKMM